MRSQLIIMVFLVGVLQADASAARPVRPRGFTRPLAALLRDQQRVTGAIVTTRGTIRTLSTEIEVLENRIAYRRTTANGLVSQIQSRRAEIASSRERKRTVGIFGALIGVPAVAVVSLVQMENDDARLRQLNQELALVTRERDALELRLTTFRDQKTQTESDLDTLRTRERTIDAQLAALAPRPRSVRAAAARLRTSQALLGNVQDQLALVRDLHGTASALGHDFGQHVAVLQHQLASADRLVAESTKEYLDLLEAMVKKGPHAGAMSWLHKSVTSSVARRLHEAGLGRAAARQLANRLIPRAGEGSVRNRQTFEDEVAAELATL